MSCLHISAAHWKLLRANKKAQRFNLAADTAEKRDLSSQEPEKFRTLEAAWRLWNSHNQGSQNENPRDELAEPSDEP